MADSWHEQNNILEFIKQTELAVGSACSQPQADVVMSLYHCSLFVGITYPILSSDLFNLPGGTVLPRFLFQNWYVNCGAC